MRDVNAKKPDFLGMQERMDAVNRLWTENRKALREALADQHPDWTGAKVEEETSRELLRRADCSESQINKAFAAVRRAAGKA